MRWRMMTPRCWEDGSHEARKGLSHMLGTLPTKEGGSAKMLAKSANPSLECGKPQSLVGSTRYIHSCKETMSKDRGNSFKLVPRVSLAWREHLILPTFKPN